MKIKDLKINFRYLCGNIACMSVDSVSGEKVHNDINNEEAIILFNSLVGGKDDCKTIKTLQQQNEKYNQVIDKLKEFINQHAYRPSILRGQLNLNYKEFDELLDILKEVE